MSGRGAWPGNGRGGTLKRLKDGSTPRGSYYLLAVSPAVRVGRAAVDAKAAGETPPMDDLAVWYGVRAIQLLLNLAGASPKLVLDGVFGKGTDAGVRAFQAKEGIKVDGSVGPTTMQHLLLPHIKRLGTVAIVSGQPKWSVVYGFLANEGAWDPGAVGYIDDRDLGLAQINSLAHPNLTGAERFDPVFAIQFNIDYLNSALARLDHNLRDAVLSYNLGVGGTRTWIEEGRPRYYTPDDGPLRDTTRYVDGVLNAYKEL